MKKILAAILLLAFASSSSQATSYNFMVFFDSESTIVRENGQLVIREFIKFHLTAVEKLKGFSVPGVLLEGYADRMELNGKNLELSRQRVEAVRDLLVKGGVAENTIAYRWWGDTRPLVLRNDKIEEPQNRHVRLLLY